ncbi:hypothetical protein GGD81_002473 [Rhodobium orientis]|uniref:hypothetical protein n=1 Tax=Rhodobium orientis TaxID=34017 RepID=UPI0011B942F3|nr:hypothetical protein [Rhodobium orientis]MBB4303430.1 hypothetical protein [Rhodobium orientis]
MSGVRDRLTYLLAAGAVAGALDIGFACIFWAIKADTPMTLIFQSVAAGLLGPVAFEGGVPTAALGLALHFFITTLMAAAYFYVASHWSALRRRPLVFGGVYGVFLYGLMNFVVIPLSAASPGASDALWIGMSVLAHIVFVGVPIALLARRAP